MRGLIASAALALAGALGTGCAAVARDAASAPGIGGVFPLLCTPYTPSGELDAATLAREARFVADCGADGVIWPAANEALGLLTPDEERRGWEAIAGALDGRGVWFCPCCPGTDVTDQLRRLEVAGAVAARHPGLRLTALVRMADASTNDVQYAADYEAIAARVRHPVIVQTYNAKSPAPSPRTLIDLARRHPGTYGWFKAEGTGKGIVRDIEALVAAKPVVKTVFTGWGGRDWPYHYRRLGTRGVITQRPMYADLLVAIWRAYESGDPKADELFAKFAYLRILDDALPSDGMRGWNLYVLRRRGVFPNTLSRVRKPGGGWTVKDVELTDAMRAEIDARLAYSLHLSACRPRE